MHSSIAKSMYTMGFVLLLIPCAQTFAANAQWSNGYSYRRAITIDHTKVPNADQINFPVLISGTYSYLATTAHGGNVASGNGYDIIFTSDGTGTNLLPYERDSYNASTGAVSLWVQIPTVSHTSDTVFYIFYGNSSVNTDQSQPTLTWDSNYTGVWHLPNGTTLTTSDSTVNANNGTNHGATATTGRIGGAASFNGSNQYLDLGTSSTLQPSGAISASAWVKASSTQVYYPQIVTNGDSSGVTGYNLYLQNSSGQGVAAFIVNVGGWGPCYVYGSTNLKDNSWHYLVGTYTGAGGTISIYVDGGLGASGSCPNQTTNYGTSPRGEIGWKADQGTNDDFNGVIDEVRISASARSANWTATEYNNQSSPSTFYAIASADTQGSNSFSYSRPITISHTKVPNTDQPNFPVLISGTYPYLATTANGGNVSNANGYDIIFTSDSAGANPLPFERESYNATTGAVIFWVQVPIVSHTSDTVIYMFYGNPSVIDDQQYGAGVWDSNYKGVWHLPNGTTLTGNDSTINGDTGTNYGATAATGEVDGAAAFNGSNEYVDLGTSSTLRPTGAITASAWIKAASTQAYYPMVVTEADPNTAGYNLFIQNGSNQGAAGFIINVGGWGTCYAQGTTNLKDNTWHYVAGSYTPGGTINIYVDGTLQTNSSCPNQSTNYGTSPRGEIGSENVSANTVYFNGAIDEVRVSSIARSADWITTEYNNQSAPSTFYTIGAAQSGGADSWGPTISSLTPSSGSVDTPITITGTNFGITQNGSIVNFNGVAATATNWNNTSIVVLVPDGATTGNVTVRISGVTSNGASFTVLGPVISTLAPTQGPTNTSVTITGTGFGSTRGSSTVTFNGTAVTTYSAWSATSITVTVPSGATSGGVIVTVSNVASDDAPFTVTGSAPSTSDIYYYFSDALGTARLITTSDGTVCYDADLYPYGGVRTYNSTCGPSEVFTTYERDPETNNDYAMARYYSSRLGRFMSPDPTGIFLGNLNDPQSLNLYSRVRNNPLNLSDPTGLFLGPLPPTTPNPVVDAIFSIIDIFCLFFCGGGGGHGSLGPPRRGPQPPIYNVPDIGTSLNGTLTSDDPFSGEPNGSSPINMDCTFSGCLGFLNSAGSNGMFRSWWKTLIAGIGGAWLRGGSNAAAEAAKAAAKRAGKPPFEPTPPPSTYPANEPPPDLPIEDPFWKETLEKIAHALHGVFGGGGETPIPPFPPEAAPFPVIIVPPSGCLPSPFGCIGGAKTPGTI